MDIELENRISNAFIYPNKRERFLFDRFEKHNDRSRMDAVCRLPEIIDASLKMKKDNHFPAPDDLIKILKAHGVGDTCYVISDFEGFDGVIAPIEEAVNTLNTNGFPSLIVGLPSGFAHLKEESYASYQPNCFVRPRIRLDGIPWDN